MNPYQNIYNMVCWPYIKEEGNLDTWIAKNLDEFSKSGNIGLVKQIGSWKRYLEELSRSYIMLNLADVEKRIKEREKDLMSDKS